MVRFLLENVHVILWHVETLTVHAVHADAIQTGHVFVRDVTHLTYGFQKDLCEEK